MRRIVLVLILALAPATALAAENDPDCEASQTDPGTTDGKDKVSERSTPTRQHVNRGTGVCEGEQWDGQDPTGAQNSGTGVILLDSLPGGRFDRVGVYYRSGPNPSDPNIGNDPLDAAHVRVIGQGSPGWKESQYYANTGQLYTHVAIWGVGSASTAINGSQYLAPCVARGGALCSPTIGSDPRGKVGALETAVYLEDNSDQAVRAVGLCEEFDAAYNAAHAQNPTSSNPHQSVECNVLAAAVHFPHITLGQDVGEESTPCSQSTYVAGGCKRDNTAATVELLA